MYQKDPNCLFKLFFWQFTVLPQPTKYRFDEFMKQQKKNAWTFCICPNMYILVSLHVIVISVYHAKQTLELCLASLICQSIVKWYVTFNQKKAQINHRHIPTVSVMHQQINLDYFLFIQCTMVSAMWSLIQILWRKKCNSNNSWLCKTTASW